MRVVRKTDYNSGLQSNSKTQVFDYVAPVVTFQEETTMFVSGSERSGSVGAYFH